MSKILKLPQVMEATALSRSSIYDYIKDKKFPAPTLIGVRAVGWLEQEIEDWIAQRIEASRSKKVSV